MSRSGYTDEPENLAMWRGQVRNATRGKRGQAFLRDLLAALGALPDKRLVANSFQADGEVCTLGCIGRARAIDMTELNNLAKEVEDEYCCDSLPRACSSAFDIAYQLAAEIMFMNDEYSMYDKETPERRYSRMRLWVASQILPEAKP